MPPYSYQAKFYLHNDIPCREVLFIKQLRTQKQVDLLVVMMNPGSSHPAAVVDYHSITEDLWNKFVPTEPDTTQNRIVEYMEQQQLEHACVFNLTNVCNQKSTSLRAADCQFSNFLTIESARTFIHQHTPNAKHVLIAWGCKAIFRTLIINCKQAITEIDDVQIFGFNQIADRRDLYYYHPLKHRGDWAEGIREVVWEVD